MTESYLLLHGLGGSGPTHWQTWLYRELIKVGKKVYYPTLPEYDKPQLSDWLKELDQTFQNINKDEKLTVIAHSLGCILWLQYIKNGLPGKAERVLLVAPPSPYYEHESIQAFFPIDIKGIENNQPFIHTVQIQSTNDPYCSIEDSHYFKQLGIRQKIIVNKGHINVESGFGPWPWVLDYCLKKKQSSFEGGPILKNEQELSV